ncbi:MAG: serine/threonine protein kinase [Planctomycetaceae bacterium]|nr:serine/threonine protein kinase [Planctomycetaceae bacterium]
MSIVPGTAHLSSPRLRMVLSESDTIGELSLTDDELNHLEHCPHCQQSLASESGEGAWLTEFRDTIQTDANWDAADSLLSSGHSDFSGHGGSNIAIVLDSSAGDGQHPEAGRIALDFLESPRHPELLGRLGRYDVERLVGVGGFGVVLKAFDTELHRVVALKVLAPHLMSSGAARKRFARESQAAAAIQHENVIPIFDVVADDQVSYLVMQFIAGTSLQERVDRHGPLSVEETLRIAAQIAAGLAAAHAQGVVHRDVKPANVLLESSLERVLISDFGLAQTADDASLTRSGVIAGTPHYMSPEQSMGESVDARTDLFSLGSVMYFMLAGHAPFRARQVMAVLNRICNSAPRNLLQLRTDVPDEVLLLIGRLHQKSPAQRFSDSHQLHGTLLELLSDLRQGRLRPRQARFPVRWQIFGGTLLLGLVAAVAAWSGLFSAATNATHNLIGRVDAVTDTDNPTADATAATTSFPSQPLPPEFWAGDGDPWYSEVHRIQQQLKQLEQQYASQGLSPAP